MYETYKEIFLQKDVLSQTRDRMNENRRQAVDFIKAYDPGEIVFIGCGSSYWLSMSACLTMQRETGIRCTAIKSGDVIMDSDCYSGAFRRPLVISASRTGTTIETVMAAKKFKEWYKAPLLLITEYEKCPLGEIADLVIREPWAREVSVMQTRSFSSLYLSLVMLSAFVSGNDKLLGEIDWYIDNYDRLASDVSVRAEKIGSQDFKGYEHVVTLGSGCQYGVAVEGGYIQQELAKFGSGYFATLEYRHGPCLTNNDKTLFGLFSTGDMAERENNVMGELLERGGRVILISGNAPQSIATWNFTVGRDTAKEVVALYGIMVMQGIAYYQALRGGVNPDNPNNKENDAQYIEKI